VVHKQIEKKKICKASERGKGRPWVLEGRKEGGKACSWPAAVEMWEWGMIPRVSFADVCVALG
jgi:hypothetical protein